MITLANWIAQCECTSASVLNSAWRRLGDVAFHFTARVLEPAQNKMNVTGSEGQSVATLQTSAAPLMKHNSKFDVKASLEKNQSQSPSG